MKMELEALTIRMQIYAERRGISREMRIKLVKENAPTETSCPARH